MTKKVTIIVNPIAGSGRARHLVKRLIRQLNRNSFEPELKLTAQSGDALQATSTTNESLAIICVGGDGTVNEIINGLMLSGNNSKFPLGIIPSGSGNVIAKELELSDNINKFVSILKKGKTRCLDVGRVNFPGQPSWYFISMAGIGFDAEITRLYQTHRKGAKLQAHLFSYLPLGLKRILSYQIPQVEVEIDDKLITTQACFVQVANVRSYGGPFIMVGSAQPDDGWLDICWFRGRNNRDILKYFWYAFWSEASRCSDAHCLRGKKIKVSSAQLVPLQVDGDYRGNLPVEIEIIPQAISILVA